MDTPVSKSAQHTFVPVNLFLRGLDYKVRSDDTAVPPTPARVNVVRLRLEQIQKLQNLTSRIRRTVQSVVDADRHGSALPPADLLLSMTDDLRGAAHRLYKDIESAQVRYTTSAAADVEADAAADAATTASALATEAHKPAGGIHMTVKPTDIHHPATMEQAIRAVKLGNGGRPAGRGGW